MPMRKSEFLRNLSTATTRFVAGMEPNDESFTLTKDPRVVFAKGHAKDLAIFIEDPVHFRDEDNPVVRAVMFFGMRQLLKSASSPVEELEMVECAWEYFEKKTWQFVNLYSDGNGSLTTDDGKESGNPRRFVVKARLVPYRAQQNIIGDGHEV